MAFMGFSTKRGNIASRRSLKASLRHFVSMRWVYLRYWVCIQYFSNKIIKKYIVLFDKNFSKWTGCLWTCLGLANRKMYYVYGRAFKINSIG